MHCVRPGQPAATGTVVGIPRRTRAAGNRAPKSESAVSLPLAGDFDNRLPSCELAPSASHPHLLLHVTCLTLFVKRCLWRYGSKDGLPHTVVDEQTDDAAHGMGVYGHGRLLPGVGAVYNGCVGQALAVLVCVQVHALRGIG